ncbi:hypothetical protein [Nostoc sp. TCL26-01]|uniref:hypothetical protein n=1 Tax=Nostoc sp. TCL26-01 TaxID=2576904 RepID=UPI0015BBC2A1|nr:hypothetical protein [Nostoc sp. TCL26-01]
MAGSETIAVEQKRLMIFAEYPVSKLIAKAILNVVARFSQALRASTCSGEKMVKLITLQNQAQRFSVSSFTIMTHSKCFGGIKFSIFCPPGNLFF